MCVTSPRVEPSSQVKVSWPRCSGLEGEGATVGAGLDLLLWSKSKTAAVSSLPFLLLSELSSEEEAFR